MNTQGRIDERVRRRREAVRLVDEGWTQAAVAARVGVTERTIRNWVRRKREEGDEGLADRPRPGRASKLTKRQKAGLRQRLLKGARANGFDTELWTCPRIRELIRRQYGVEYRVESLPYLLSSLGFTCQKPQLRAVERDDAAIQTWVARDWPRIKKSPSAEGPARVRR
jgi:transposase